ncbi:unnamed protein product [Cylindrotheca closterium]|uniref:CRAL/TRIO N-terminal domain-containing protein n=1 Tax=Cylindrotheca closterium TaxID=2856 RepID=A0AAD2FN14_9STRA|nr:unnamed protein product [Cylindrotheca closterium]
MTSNNSILDVQYNTGCCDGSSPNNQNMGTTPEPSCFRSTRGTQDNPTVVPVDEMTVLVANEMNKLTFQEREVVYEDLHGVSRPGKECHETLAQTIADTRNEIASIRLKAAHNKAVFLNPEYVNSENFILMFLRACKFDPKKTAIKIVDHFKYKLELFGYDNLGKEITYEDLNEGTRNALSSGAVQLLPNRDKAGRAIVFFSFASLRYENADDQLRAIWYIMMCKLTDPEVQRHGTVQVHYNVHYSTPNLHLDLLLRSSMIAKAMPQQILGVHFCYDNEIVQPILSMLQMIVGSAARLRFRSHFGSPLEIKYSLQNFGIPYESLPLDHNGQMDCSKIHAFIEEQIQAEERRKEQGGRILHPRSRDVLMGRGWHQQEHPGNLELARIVDEKRHEYKAARKLHKTNLNWTIVEIIKDGGGRFLERSHDSDECAGVGWAEASDENARDKVSKCFRTTTKRNSKNGGSAAAAMPNMNNDAEPFPVSSSYPFDSVPNKKARVAI